MNHEFGAGVTDAGERLDRWLVGQCETWSRSQVQSWIRAGLVLCDGIAVTVPKQAVREGAVYCVMPPEPMVSATVAQPIPLDVLFEDEHLIVINKPAGLVVHPAAGHPDGTLVNALLHHCGDLQGIGGERRPGIVHRLDKDTSGVMVAAKNQPTHDSLALAFQAHEVEKRYVALTRGVPSPLSGTLETPIGRSPTNRKKMSVLTAGGKLAISHYQVKEVWQGYAMVEVRIDTGRTHQIRVHMAHIHCPIIGDCVYGRKKCDLLVEMTKRQMLHAVTLSLRHPVHGQHMSFEAPLPEDMQSVIAYLRHAAS